MSVSRGFSKFHALKSRVRDRRPVTDGTGNGKCMGKERQYPVKVGYGSFTPLFTLSVAFYFSVGFSCARALYLFPYSFWPSSFSYSLRWALTEREEGLVRIGEFESSKDEGGGREDMMSFT